jgi:hypothetical protein
MTVLCKSKISRETASYIVGDGVGNFLPTPTSVTSYPQSLHRLSSYPPSYAPFKPLCPNTLGKAAIESKTLNAETKRGGMEYGDANPGFTGQGLASRLSLGRCLGFDATNGIQRDDLCSQQCFCWGSSLHGPKIYAARVQANEISQNRQNYGLLRPLPRHPTSR